MSLSYQIDLWDGTKVVFERFLEGKRLMKETIEFLKERTAYEETYAKSVQKIAKISEKSVEGRSTESIPVCFSAMRIQADNASKSHSACAATLQTSLLAPLKTLKVEQSKLHKQYESEVSKLNKELEKQRSNLAKAKTKFHGLSREAEVAEQASQKGESENLPAKELTKLKTKSQNLQKQAESADEAYKTAVNEHQQFQVKYEEEMKNILNQYQQLEEKRNEFLQDLMEKYHLALENLALANEQSAEALKQKVTIIDHSSDMQAFLSDKQTHQEPPPPVQYEPYIPLNDKSRLSMQMDSYKRNSYMVGSASDESKRLSRAPSAANTLGRSNSKQSNSSRGSNEDSTRNVANVFPTATTATTTSNGTSDVVPPTTTTTTTTPVKQQPPLTSQQPPKQTIAEPPLPSESESEYEIPALPKPRRARANFAYNADEDNELSFAEGQLIMVDKMDPSGWWHGSYDDKSGLFPGNYCDLLPEDDGSSAGNAANGGNSGVIGVGKPSIGKPRQCRAAFDFTAQNEDELTIKENEILSVESEAEGWFLVVNEKGEEGLVPGTYVEVIN